MKKLSKFVWILALSIPPVFPMDSMDAQVDSPTEGKVLCRSEGWENGKKMWEEVVYVPFPLGPLPPQQSIRPSGMGAWESGDFGTWKQYPQTIFYGGQDNYR